MTLVLTGLDVEEKAALVERSVRARFVGPRAPRELHFQLARTDAPDPDIERARQRALHDPGEGPRRAQGRPRVLVRARRADARELPGPLPDEPARRRERVRRLLARARARPARSSTARCCPDGRAVAIPPVEPKQRFRVSVARGRAPGAARRRDAPRAARRALRRALGRQGRQREPRRLGEDATPPTPGSPRFLTVDRLKQLLPETRRARGAPLRAPEPALAQLRDRRACSARASRRSLRPDAQAKSLGEWLRAREAELPEALLGG